MNWHITMTIPEVSLCLHEVWEQGRQNHSSMDQRICKDLKRKKSFIYRCQEDPHTTTCSQFILPTQEIFFNQISGGNEQTCLMGFWVWFTTVNETAFEYSVIFFSHIMGSPVQIQASPLICHYVFVLNLHTETNAGGFILSAHPD